MDDAVRRDLERDLYVDITTTGRKSGRAHRVEVTCRYVDGQIYLSNNPGPRDWAANLLAHPEFTYHVKQSVKKDFKSRATAIRDPELRRQVFTAFLTKEHRLGQLEARMQRSHLFRADLLDQAVTG